MRGLRRFFKLFEPVNKIGFTNKVNVFLNILENKTRRNKLLAHPIILDIVPTKLCNLDCVFCIQSSTIGATELSLDNFKIIAKKLFPYALVVNFCSDGEPFLNKNFMEFLSICKNYKVPVSITSNGTLLSEAICTSLVKNNYATKFNFSFDGIKKQTVESIRRGINYQKVIDNMCLMVDLKKRYKQKYPLLMIRYTAMRKNIEELPELIQYASSLGINGIVVTYLNVANEIDRKESLFYHPALAKSIFEEADRLAKELKIQLKLPPLIGAQNKIKACDMPWQFIKIGPDGSVRFCYKAWDNPVGNILEEGDFYSLWNSKHYQLIRKTVNTTKPYFKYCSVCCVRNGPGEESSHIQYQREDLYEFDKAYENLYNIKIPARLHSKPKNERGIISQKDK